MIDSINKSLYDFLWNKKSKIKKDVIVNQYAKGGLKMTNLNAFMNALKSPWVRRILTSDSKWQEFMKIHLNLEKLMSCDTEHIRETYNTISNEFWKDVLKSVIDIDMRTEATEERILECPLYYN